MTLLLVTANSFEVQTGSIIDMNGYRIIPRR